MPIVFVTVVCLLVFGLGYAWLEYKRPILPTYQAVVFGVGVSMLGQVVLTLVLDALGYGPAGIVAGIVAPFVLTGLPMAIAQEIKERGFIDEGNHKRGNTGDLGELREDDGDTP